MRYRPLAAGAALALLTTMWTAPTAFAAPADDATPEPGGTLAVPTASQAPPSPAVRTFRAPDGQDGDGRDGQQPRGPRPTGPTGGPTSSTAPSSRPGAPNAGRPVAPGGGTGVQGDTVPRSGGLPGNGGPAAGVPAAGFDPRLPVLPSEVRPGGVLTLPAGCSARPGRGAAFTGGRGIVDLRAVGDLTLTLGCVVDGVERTLVKVIRVLPLDRGPACERDRQCHDGGRGPGRDRDRRDRFIYLDPGAGFRGDDVDVSVRCTGDRAFLKSDVLRDITLRREGNRLTGRTHVEDRADFGRGWVRVECGDGDRFDYDTRFRVLRDRGEEEFLDLDPAFGERGDEVDVTVQCRSGVGELRSDVLDDIRLDRSGRSSTRFRGTTHVEDDAERGEHTVSVRCGDRTLEEEFFVKGDGDGDSGDGDSGDGDSDGDSGDGDNDADSGGDDGGDQTSVYPVGAPETGGGPAGALGGLPALGLSGIVGAAASGSASTNPTRTRQEGQR